MVTAYFDCYNGISGDMTLGALVDCGVPVDALRGALSSLRVSGWTLSAERVRRCGIGATLMRVGAREHHAHRGLREIRGIIEGSSLNDRVKSNSIRVFERLANAEAAVHGISPEEVHFHEVGAVDAIVDIAGSIWGLDSLGVTEVHASVVTVGTGRVQTAHGEMPVPAPATVRLLEGVPITTGPLPGEMTTPTGAAILTTVASRFGPIERFRIAKAGYGAGSREYPGQTNYLRLLLGESEPQASALLERRELVILQTEIDDMPAETFGYVAEKLFAAGCLDAHFQPVQMKKNRPGTSIQVLADPERIDALLELLLRETSTFGVRLVRCDRYCLRRSFENIGTPLGEITIKIGYWGDEIVKATAEYEDCRRIAREKNLPLSEVFSVANAAIRQWRERS